MQKIWIWPEGMTSQEKARERNRIWMKAHYNKNPARVLAINRKSLAKRKAENPVALTENKRAYNIRYIERHPGRRRKSVAAYRKKNLAVCNQRTIDNRRKRFNSDPEFRMRCRLSIRVVSALKAIGKRKSGRLSYKTDGIVKWFEWLRRKRYADWTVPGIQFDHVIPISRWNIGSFGAQNAVNYWRNLFPLSRHENSVKSDRIDRAYIRKVWKLADAYLNERS